MNDTRTFNREHLIEELAAGLAPKFLLFWGHRIPKDGSLTKSCLSQWFPSPFTIDSVRYATAAH